MSARRLVQALGGRWTGSSGIARCPSHDDHQPSLSIRDGVDGEPVFNCFAGCDWRDVKDALRADGLLPERGGAPARAPASARAAPAPKRRGRRGAEAGAVADADQQQRIEFARRKWHEAVPLTDSPAEVYLRARGLVPGPDGWPPSLRYHLALRHGFTGLLLPALVAAITIWPGRAWASCARSRW